MATKTAVKFNRYNVTNGTTKARVSYSLDNRWDGRRCVTLYAKDYSGNLGVIMGDAYHNATDIQTDYFDQGHVDLMEEHPLYAAARARAEQVAAQMAAKRTALIKSRLSSLGEF